VRVTFPPILEGDIPSEVKAVVEAMTLGTQSVIGIDERTGVRELLRLIGVDDPEAVIEAMYPEASYDPDRTLEPEPSGEPPEPGAVPVAREAVVLRAVRELRHAVAKLRENGVPRS
jgi:hypothetical protein